MPRRYGSIGKAILRACFEKAVGPRIGTREGDDMSISHATPGLVFRAYGSETLNLKFYGVGVGLGDGL